MHRLYYHKTTGGAEYLSDAFIECAGGHREGTFRDANVIVRLDGEPEISCDPVLAKCAPELLVALEAITDELDYLITEFQDDYPEDHPARAKVAAGYAAIAKATEHSN